jgi:hypothetical protein
MTYLPKRLSLDPNSIKGVSEKVLVSHTTRTTIWARPSGLPRSARRLRL